MTSTPIPSPRFSFLSLAVVVVFVVGASSGCGAAARPSASPASPEVAQTSPADHEKNEVAAAAPPTASVDGPSTPPAPATVAPSAEGRDRSGPTGEFERAARTLEAAPSDCRQACRALASMDRACGQLCQLDTDQTCGDDKERLRSARRRVRTSCGSCPDGTSVEPDGPIPQRR